MDIKEFEIPVPWGHLAVKAWGDEANTPVLLIHGIGDNAGSFDLLLPYLPTTFYYICIDLPNHGRSSNYPIHVITLFDNVYTIKLVVNYLNRKKYILMGHSWGAQAVTLFTQSFPECVIKLIVLDALYIFPTPVEEFKPYLRKRFKDWIQVNSSTVNKQPQLYTYEEAVAKLCNKRLFGKLTKESAEALLTRILIPADDGKYVFSKEAQLKSSVNPLMDMKFIEDVIKKYPITCPSLFVYVANSEWIKHYDFTNFLKELKKNKNYTVKKLISNDHGIHTNNPEAVSPLINEFLRDVKHKL